MATITKTLSPSQIEALYQKLQPFALRKTTPQYTHWQLKLEQMSVTAYLSGKVVWQGADLSWLEEDSSPKSSSASSLPQTFPQAGSDEVGTGDYFGPVVVACVVVPDEAAAARLAQMHITDSKAMTDEAIRKAAGPLKQIVSYSIQVLDNTRYNQIYQKDSMNLNAIKARMHNQSYLNLKAKGVTLPKLMVVDQFCLPSTYYKYLKNVPEVISSLHFETKAESRYPAVAAASVLARDAFLQAMDALEKRYHMPIARGGGAKATESARKLVEAFGKKELEHAVKLHFANTRMVLNPEKGS